MSSMRSFRKGLELLVIYIIFIIGIFIIQFRTDLNIIEKIGNLQITLTKIENSEDDSLLQNKLQIGYNGLNFHADDQNPARIYNKKENISKNIKLVSYEKPSDSKILFNFSDDVKISFETVGEDLEETLTIIALLPENVDACYIPYGLSYNLKVQKEEDNRIILSNKKSLWALSANKLSDGLVCLTSKDSVARLAAYDDTKKFSLDMVGELAEANVELYNATINRFTNNMISMFRLAIEDGSYTEQEIASFVAARSKNGKFTEALDEIPASFKKGNKRTYLTTPYFNNLADMNITLDKAIKANNDKLVAAASTDNLEIFNTIDLASMLCIHENPENTQTILQRAANADLTQVSIATVTGILKTYVDLSNYNSSYAAILEPLIPACFEKIEASSSIENNKVSIADNGQYISVIQAVNTGITIMRYGELISNDSYIKIGRAIINTYLADATLDLKTASTLYPQIEYNNWYYPHFAVVNPDESDFIWSWTCAKSITSTRDEKDNLTLSIDFPLEYTHYVIVKGIAKFSSIYIYDVAFRTDPRFESYNSSGYVYKEDGFTLLLKSRQKSEVETVRLVYNSGVPSRKADVKTAKKEAAQKPKVEKKYSVVLEVSSTKQKKAIITEIRAIRPDLSDKDANKLFASAPTTLADNLTKEQADKIVERITNAGGTATRK